VRLVFAGTPDVAVRSLQALLGCDRHEVVAVVTRPDAPAGRGRRPTRSPVGALADEAGLEVLTPRRPAQPDFLARLSALAPDCCPVVGYGALVPRAALDIPEHGWVNLHFSLLPSWRGAAPVQAAIRHGDKITGASTFALDEGLDTGPVYGTVTEVIRPEDTAGELLSRLASSGAALLVATDYPPGAPAGRWRVIRTEAHCARRSRGFQRPGFRRASPSARSHAGPGSLGPIQEPTHRPWSSARRRCSRR
jgi:methionyl-tRNA formyltransferase